MSQKHSWLSWLSQFFGWSTKTAPAQVVRESKPQLRNIDKETARRLVYEHINQDLPSGDEYIVLDEYTVEKEYGWIFYHQSRQYIETGDDNELLAGNAPIIVDKSDGSLYQTSSANSDSDIKKFEAARKSQ